MNRVLLLALTLFYLNLTALANIDQVESEKQPPQKKQKMERGPSSTAIGGSRSGQLEMEKKKDEEKKQREFEKQKKLYEYEGYYRRGL